MILAGGVWAASQVGALTLMTLHTQDHERGRQNSVLLGSRTLGRAFGGPVVGSLTDITGTYTAGILVSTGICLLGGFYARKKVHDPPVNALDPSVGES